MSKLFHMVLLIALAVCSSMLIHRPSGSAETLGKPKLEMPGMQSGGTFRRLLGNNPSTLGACPRIKTSGSFQYGL